LKSNKSDTELDQVFQKSDRLSPEPDKRNSGSEASDEDNQKKNLLSNLTQSSPGMTRVPIIGIATPISLSGTIPSPRTSKSKASPRSGISLSANNTSSSSINHNNSNNNSNNSSNNNIIGATKTFPSLSLRGSPNSEKQRRTLLDTIRSTSIDTSSLDDSSIAKRVPKKKLARAATLLSDETPSESEIFAKNISAENSPEIKKRFIPRAISGDNSIEKRAKPKDKSPGSPKTEKKITKTAVKIMGKTA